MTKKTTKRNTTLAPIQARTFNDINRLPRAVYDGKTWWFLIDGGHVTMCQQKRGEASTGTVFIPRGEFDRLVRWYTTPRRVAQ